MKVPKDIDALNGIIKLLQKIRDESGDTAGALAEILELSASQAASASDSLIGRLAVGSADTAIVTMDFVRGKWMRSHMDGNVGSYLSTVTEAYDFRPDFQYTYLLDKYESYSSPLMSYNKPYKVQDAGIWLPGNYPPNTVVLCSVHGRVRTVSVTKGSQPIALAGYEFLTPKQDAHPNRRVIDGTSFDRTTQS